MSKVVTKSRYFNRIADGKSVDVDIDRDSLAGVKVIDRGNKKGTEVELLLPRGSKNVRLTLSGRQAYSLFNTLATHYVRTGKM